MADLNTAADTLAKLKDGGLIAAGGTLLTILGAFLGPLISGATRQEKDLRDGLAARIAKLEERVTTLEAENERYRKQAIADERKFMYVLSDRERIRRERDALRSEVNDLRANCGKTAHVWADDPSDPTF